MHRQNAVLCLPQTTQMTSQSAVRRQESAEPRRGLYDAATTPNSAGCRLGAAEGMERN